MKRKTSRDRQGAVGKTIVVGMTAPDGKRLAWRLSLAAGLIQACFLLASCEKTPTANKLTSNPTDTMKATTQQTQAFKPFYFIFTGDPHVGFSKGTNRRFERQLRQINRLKPAFALIPGDMTHGLKEKMTDALDSALEKFEVPVRFVPGNHDIRDHKTLQTWRRKYGKDYYVFTHNNCDFICLNSITFSTDTRYFKNKDEQFSAEVAEQWRWLEKTLAHSRHQKRTHVFILLHIPPYTKTEDERHKLTNMHPTARKRLLTLARKYRVRVILAGHTHITRECNTGDFTIYTVGGTFRPVDLRGYGYRIFKVQADWIAQKYVRLDKPPKKLDF